MYTNKLKQFEKSFFGVTAVIDYDSFEIHTCIYNKNLIHFYIYMYIILLHDI